MAHRAPISLNRASFTLLYAASCLVAEPRTSVLKLEVKSHSVMWVASTAGVP